MEERRWENMDSDCLVNVFVRLDLESRLLDVPLACKHWYQTLLNPLCWHNLGFPLLIRGSRLADAFEGGRSRNISGLVKFVVGRSQGCATKLVLPIDITEQDLIYVSDECPALKILSVPYGDTLSELIVKWKSLEVLRIRSCYCDVQIIENLSLHCKNLIWLSVEHADIDDEVASAIVSKLPTIKGLNLERASIEKVNVLLILRGCKELERLYVCYCVGFDEDDEEVLKLASGIKDFRCEGSRNDDDSEEFDDHISYDDLFSDGSSD